MAAQHTPAPWKYGVRPDGSMWMSFGNPERGSHSQFDFDGREEDARLIVAAPYLLEMLKRTLEELRLIGMKDCGAVYDTTCRIEAKIAIAKAEGRAP